MNGSVSAIKSCKRAHALQTYIHTHTHTYIYIYIERERERERERELHSATVRIHRT